MQPLIVLNTVGLTSRRLPLAPRIHALAKCQWHRTLKEVVPAVTCTSQATLLTGKDAEGHGIVGNGWYWRDLGEVRFWLQSNRLIQAEPFYETARRLAVEQGKRFRCAKLFWWFNQGAAVDWSVTPKPHYGADGNKVFDIQSSPPELAGQLKEKIGPFPFPAFWGPMSGLASSRWIARCAAEIITRELPELTLVYLPHLDYDTQRFGPTSCDWGRILGELDEACAPMLDAAQATGSRVWVVNEYTHVQVSKVVEPNRVLRRAGLLSVRDGYFGEQLDPHASRAFAVCDHQLAHVYVHEDKDRPRIRELLRVTDGVGDVLEGEARSQVGLNHARAGDLVLLSQADSWFAYPYWLDDRRAPDYARTIDIHRKPGYDPCELFLDPQLRFPRGRVARRLLQKKLGFRMLLDVVPLDARIVKGSHGLRVADPEDKPILIGDGAAPDGPETAITDVAGMILRELGFG
jgi:predicted AlkP superfamily pyrophosphatase or phosphodiesterase